jgi:hypothetical protein
MRLPYFLFNQLVVIHRTAPAGRNPFQKAPPHLTQAESPERCGGGYNHICVSYLQSLQ